jgi:hypothetical protein
MPFLIAITVFFVGTNKLKKNGELGSVGREEEFPVGNLAILAILAVLAVQHGQMGVRLIAERVQNQPR